MILPTPPWQRRVWRCARFVLVLTIALAMNSAAQAGLVFVNGFDSSWATNPNAAAATAVVLRVEAEYSSLFSNNATIHLQFGWTEVGGQPVGAGGGAELEPVNPGTPSNATYSLTQVETMLKADAAANPQNTVLNAAKAFFPATYNNPGGSSNFYINDAEYMAMNNGATQNSHSINAYVGFGADYFQGGFNGWNYGTSPVSNQLFFQGVVEHEIAHAMGRIDTAFYNLFGLGNPPTLLPLDLYKYDGGTSTLDPTDTTTWFSTNGGATDQLQYNANSDTADWNNAPGDSFNAFDGASLSLSQTDLNEMYALGWNPFAPQGPPSSTPEPCTLLLLGQGVALFGFVWRNQRKRRDEK